MTNNSSRTLCLLRLGPQLQAIIKSEYQKIKDHDESYSNAEYYDTIVKWYLSCEREEISRFYFAPSVNFKKTSMRLSSEIYAELYKVCKNEGQSIANVVYTAFILYFEKKKRIVINK